MKLPPKLIAKHVLVSGGAYRRRYKFKADKAAKLRYFFILNKDPQSDDLLIVVTSTTKLSKTAKYSYHPALVYVNPEEYPPFTDRSVINCMLVETMPKRDLLRAINGHQVILLEALPDSVLERCRKAIEATPTADSNIKQLVLGDIQGQKESASKVTPDSTN